MKTIFLHGLGQSARDWQPVTAQLDCAPGEADCPELFSWAEPGQLTYSNLLAGLERYCGAQREPFRLCGLSLGAVLALDYAIRHPDGPAAPAALVLAGAQYKIPTGLIDLQNLLFRLMPRRAFAEMGVSKQDFIGLARSMRTQMSLLRSSAVAVLRVFSHCRGFFASLMPAPPFLPFPQAREHLPPRRSPRLRAPPGPGR